MNKTNIIIRIAILLSLVLSFGHAANIGDNISNTASMTYNIGGVDKNETTNEANSTVVQTPATIEFLAFSPDDTNESLQPTIYIDENGNRVNMPPAVLPGGGSITPPQDIGVQTSDSYLERDLVIIRLTDIDQDTNASSQQSIELNVTNPATGDVETLILKETGPNTGVFVGYLHATPQNAKNGNGQISVHGGDRISAIYTDNGTLLNMEAQATISDIQFRLIAAKEQSKDVAGIGEFVKYTITIENISDITLKDILIEDKLPNGLKYQEGSLRIDGSLATPQISSDGRYIRYIHDKLSPKQSVQMSYVALIGAGTIDFKAINQAWASSYYGGKSNIAQTTLKLKEELYRSKGFILGRVYDANISCPGTIEQSSSRDTTLASSAVIAVDDNNRSDKCGISGVKIYLEDGRYVVTDKDGKYHFSDIANGTHVLQLDEDSFKSGYKLAKCQSNTRFAGSSRSQFVELYHGEIAKADFCLERVASAIRSGTMDISIKKLSSNEIKLSIKIGKNIPYIDPEAYLALPEGIKYVQNSINTDTQPKEMDGMLIVDLAQKHSASMKLKISKSQEPDKEIRAILYYDTPQSKNNRSEVVQVLFGINNQGKIGTLAQSYASTKIEAVKDSTPANQGDYNWTKATSQKYMPEYTPEEIDTLGDQSKIIWPPKGWVPNVSSTRIAILAPKGASVKLSLNGHKVSMLNYEGYLRGSKMSIIHYKGVDLRQGNNTIKAIIKKSGKVIGVSTREVFVESRSPASIKFVPEYSYLVADGIHNPVIAVRMLGPSGHPLRGGMVGAYTTDRTHQPKVISNDKGQYKIDSQGIAYIELEPTSRAGELELKFELYNGKKEKLNLRLNPHLRDWILVGFAEGTLGYRKLHGNAQSLSQKGIKDEFYHDGRVAFFAKGKIKGKWLLSIAYDTGRNSGDRELFDHIDPNAYYTLYNDTSQQGNDAASTKKLYVKLEKDDFSVLFGDYSTKLNTTSLANYSRSFTGLKSEYRSKNVNAVLFAANTQKLFFRDEFRGDGSKGPYSLGQKSIIDASESITIEIRKRHAQEIILSSRELRRYRDYDIDYDEGTVYFRNPLYSVDKDFNPVYIVATYELEEDDKHLTYGGRASINSDDKKYQAGASYIRESTGMGSNTLYGVDTKIQINDKLELKAEFAHSQNKKENEKISGDASKITLEYKDDNLSASLYYRKQDSSFGLGQLSKSLSATRKIGASLSKKISKLWSINMQAYQDTKYETNSSNRQNTAEISGNYKDDIWNADIGYRYTKNSNTHASNQITAKLGRDFYDGNLTAWISHDQSMGSNEDDEFPTKTALGLGWKYDQNTTLFGQLERSNKAGSISYASRAGISYQPYKDSKITYSRVYNSGGDGSRIFDTMALTKTMILGEKYKADFGYEKGISSGDIGTGDYSAYNAKMHYAGEKYSADASIGYRDTDAEDKLNIDAGIYIKQSKELALAAALGHHKTWNGDTTTRDTDLKFALAYRPEQSKVIALSRLDLIDNYTKSSTETTQTQKLVSNTHINWQTDEKWELGFHYGLKHVIDTMDNTEYASWTDLVGFNARYDIDDKWTAGIQGSVLHAYTANNLDYGLGIFVGMTPWNDAELTIGYNIHGFDDDEFSQQEYYYEGVYIKLKMKFDQVSVGKIVEGAVK